MLNLFPISYFFLQQESYLLEIFLSDIFRSPFSYPLNSILYWLTQGILAGSSKIDPKKQSCSNFETSQPSLLPSENSQPQLKILPNIPMTEQVWRYNCPLTSERSSLETGCMNHRDTQSICHPCFTFKDKAKNFSKKCRTRGVAQQSGYL